MLYPEFEKDAVPPRSVALSENRLKPVCRVTEEDGRKHRAGKWNPWFALEDCRDLVIFAVPFLLAFALWPAELLADEFTEKVRAAIEEKASDLQPRVRASNELGLGKGDGEWSVFLDNLRMACVARPRNCDVEVSNFVRRITTTAREGDSVGIPKHKVFPVLRAADYLQSLQEIANSGPSREFSSFPFVSGIALLYVVETSEAFRFIYEGERDVAGLSLDQLHGLAIENAARLKTLKVERLEGAPGIFAMIAHDGLGSSRLLDVDFRTRLERKAGGPVAFAIPTRDWILAARLDDRSALSALRALAGRIVAGEPYAVSSMLFRHDGATWREVQP